MPGHHQLRQLRAADVDPLPPRRHAAPTNATPATTSRPPRPAARSARTRSTHAVAERLIAALEPRRGRRSRSPPPTRSPDRRDRAEPRRRADRRTRPLRRRPRRTGLPRRRTGEPARRPHPGIPLGNQAGRPRRRRSRARPHPNSDPAAARTEPTCRPCSRDLPRLWRAHHHRPGPQAAAAHPDRRHHRAPRTRRAKLRHRDPLAHRRHRRDHHRPAPAAARPSRAHPGRRVELIRALGPDHQQRRARHRAQRRRTPHRQRPPVRRRRRPMGAPRPPVPTPGPLRPRRDQRHRRRRPGSASAPTRLLLDQRRTPHPPAADPATGIASPGPPRSRPTAGNGSPTQATSTDHNPNPHLQERQYETTIPTAMDRVVQSRPASWCWNRSSRRTSSRSLRVPPEAAGPGRDRRDPPLRHPAAYDVGAGCRHRGVLGSIVTLLLLLIVLIKTGCLVGLGAGYAGLFGVRCGRGRLGARGA